MLLCNFELKLGQDSPFSLIGDLLSKSHVHQFCLLMIPLRHSNRVQSFTKILKADSEIKICVIFGEMGQIRIFTPILEIPCMSFCLPMVSKHGAKLKKILRADQKSI